MESKKPMKLAYSLEKWQGMHITIFSKELEHLYYDTGKMDYHKICSKLLSIEITISRDLVSKSKDEQSFTLERHFKNLPLSLEKKVDAAQFRNQFRIQS